ncbi:autophagy protein 13, partial [Coemansia sp. RSA 1933]
MYASSASSSVADVGATGRRINKWFNMSLEDIADAKEEAKLWRHTVAAIALGQRQPLTPPPMVIEVCLDVSAVQPDDELQVADIYGRPWSVDLELAAPTPGPPDSQHFDDIFSAKGSSASSARGTHRMRATSIVLETWRLDLDARAIPQPAPDLPRVYKKAIVFFRSLYAFASLLPCASLTQTQQAGGDLLDRRQMPLFYTFRQDTMPRSGAIDLDVGLTGTERFLESHVFEPVATPMGTFSMSVQYRRESSFSCSTPNSIIAHDEYGPIGAADDTYFTPTLSSRSGSHFSAVRHQHQQQQRLHHQRTGDYVHLAADHAGRRSLTIPSVNPFRARPVSVGHAASLGSGWRGSIGESMHVARSHDSNIRAASLSGSGGGTRIRAASASATGATPIRPHSLDQRAEAILGRLSTSAATDSGSMLHRSVMLRRLGDSLSPTDSHRSGDASLRFPATTAAAAAAAAAAVEATGHVSRSPPRPGVPGARTISSGASVTASAAGRSSLGITPFKSPSLSGSPASRFVSSFAEVSETMSPPRSTDHVAAARRLTIGGGTPVPASRGSSNISSSPSHAAGMQQLMTRISDSPSSLGSGHSRGLSSSFGNRRTNSLRNRQMSLLGTSAIDHQAADSPGAMRRRTVVGGLGWADADARDIDDFIRMVESKQPLKLVRKDQHHNASDPPLSAGPVLSSPYDAIAAASGEDTLRLFHGIYNDFSGMSRDMESSVAMGTSDDHDKRRSRDAPPSYALRHEPLTATPEEDAAAERSLLPQVAAASSSSSFRRPAMPNPLMAAERTSLSRPVSIVAAGDAIPAPIPARSTEAEATQEARQQSATNIAEQPPPKAAGSSVDLLRIALSDLNIETGNHHSLKQTSSRTQGEEGYLGQKPASLATTGRMQSGLSIVGKPHVRSAAARLDPELERPLPPPVPIPRSHSATGRHHESTSRRQVSRASISSGDGEEGLGISLTPLHSMRQRPPSRERNRRPSADSTRGKSQPTARAHHDLGFAPAHRISTPQPPQLHTSPSVSSPYSHRGEFLSSNGQLDALLGLTDQIPAATSSRETPTTSQHGA